MHPLVAFIWWSTDRLTWDSTVVDFDKDASGEGLLQTIGLEGSVGGDDGSPDEGDAGYIDHEATTDKTKSKTKSLWGRWVERRRRHHTPGVWVIYFGIAAIPLFGLGQLLLPDHHRGVGFLLLCIYVASALALLMTTSFLQMRRYLIQRRLPFTDKMASTWLGAGGTIIVGLMLLCLLLPRPNTGYSLIDSIDVLSSKDRKASRFAFGEDGVKDDEKQGRGDSDREQAESDSEEGQQKSDDAKQGSQSGNKPQTKGGQQSRSGQQSSGQQKNSQPDRDRRQQSQSNREQQDRDSGDSQDADDSRQQSERRSQNDQDRNDSDNRRSDQQQERSENSESNTRQNDDDSNQQEGSRTTQAQPKPPSPTNPLQNLSLPSIPKLVYFVLIAIIVFFVFLWYGREIGAAINAFIRDFMEMIRRLFGGTPRAGAEHIEEVEVAEPEPVRAFASYQDPFLAGTADRYSPQQLVNYSFEALQAWAHERDCPRSEEQTALEFAAQVGDTDGKVGPAARNLAILYNQAAYAPGTLGKESVSHLRSLWGVLRGKSRQ